MRFGVILVLATSAVCPAWAQEPTPTPETPPVETPVTEPPAETESSTERPTLEALEAKIAELAPQIESAQAAATEETVQRTGVPLEQLVSRSDRLRAVDGLLQQQIGALQRLDELKTSQSDLDQEIAAFEERGLEEPPPYTLAFLDRLNDELLSEERNRDNLVAQSETSVAELGGARERLDEAQRARRAARDAMESNTDPNQTARLTWEANRARLEERYSEESIAARTLRRAVADLETQLSEARLQFYEAKAEVVFAATVFAREELEARFDEIAAKRDAIERALPKLRDSHQANEARRREARDALQLGQGDEAIARATATLAMRTVWVDTSARTVELAEKKLQLADQEKLLLERRFAVWQGVEDTELTDWKAETERLLEELRRDRQVQESRLIDLRTSTLDAEKQLSEWTAAQGDRSVAESKLAALRDRESALNDYLATILPVERLGDRLQGDIDRERDNLTWRERWNRVTTVLGKIWNFELFVIEDDSITVRKIVLALVILIVGIFFCGYLTRTLRTRLLNRTPLTENAAAAIEKLAYYVALIMVLLYALNFVNIPLTLFAFFGGAIAIAVGFGAQHLINNFISGFILMLERPIRIGDLVDMEGIYGHIRHIGARSTRLHTAENIDLLIPNSKLLENVVTNWTLSDEKLRTSVSVGVLYGSPTELVTELMLQATAESKKVLESPKPVVLFTDFGDDALKFEIHFWIKMRRIMDKRQAESEIRYNIDRLFRANDIVIAFPQRDVHLDSIKPLEVKMVRDDDDNQ